MVLGMFTEDLVLVGRSDRKPVVNYCTAYWERCTRRQNHMLADGETREDLQW
jgi:hypothetical protein